MRIPGRDLLKSALQTYRSGALRERLRASMDSLARLGGGSTVRDNYTDELPRVRIVGKDQVCWISLAKTTHRLVQAGIVHRSLKEDDSLFEFPSVEMHPAWMPRDYAVPWMRPVCSGQEALDARFALYSPDARSVVHVFTPAVQDALFSLHYMMETPGVSLTIGGRSVAVRKLLPSRVVTASTLRDLLRRAENLFHSVEALFQISAEGVTEIAWVRDEQADTRCRVCGEQLECAPVYCEACETPHHPDCWQYVGRCAIFACGARGFVTAKSGSGRRPAARPLLVR